MQQGTGAQKASPAHVHVHHDTASAEGMALLEAGVPLSLLLDLAGLTRATSRDLARNEKADTSWVQRRLSA